MALVSFWPPGCTGPDAARDVNVLGGIRVDHERAQDLAEIAGLDPDLILLDYYWDIAVGAPSGFMESLQAEGATAAIPVVVLTGAQREGGEQVARSADRRPGRRGHTPC